ncbi:MAG: MFS transporter [Betaproteobacteria bacterium]
MSSNQVAAPRDALEAGTYKKIAWRLVPFVFLLYVIAFLDRVNVSYAKLQMSADLGFSEAVYGFGAGLFFIGYFILEIPSNLILDRVGARLWIARILIVWGLISSAFMFVHTPMQFYVMRFLLGLGEAGFFPGIILYLTYWFPGHRRARMVATFMTAIAISGVIGGPLSGLIMKSLAGMHGLAGWQWLFLLEGLPAVVMGVVTIFYLDNGPRSAKWLTEEQKDLVVRQIAEDRESKRVPGSHDRFIDSAKDYKVWVLALIYFCNVIAFYGVIFFLPQLIKEMGVNDLLMNGLISAIPWAVAAVVMVLNGRHSDRMLERRWHVAIPAICAGIGLAVAAYVGASPAIVAMIALTVTTAGSLCISPVFWSLPTAFLTGSAAAGSIALINSFGALGGFFGPYLVGFVKDLTGSPANALYILSGFFFLCAALVLSVFNASHR